MAQIFLHFVDHEMSPISIFHSWKNWGSYCQIHLPAKRWMKTSLHFFREITGQFFNFPLEYSFHFFVKWPAFCTISGVRSSSVNILSIFLREIAGQLYNLWRRQHRRLSRLFLQFFSWNRQTSLQFFGSDIGFPRLNVFFREIIWPTAFCLVSEWYSQVFRQIVFQLFSLLDKPM